MKNAQKTKKLTKYDQGWLDALIKMKSFLIHDKNITIEQYILALEKSIELLEK